MYPIQRIVFTNGLRLLLVPRPESLAATVLILVEAGSEYETKKTNGLSHFLEHMVFKGTVRRPLPGTVAKELDALGAEYNAFTGGQYTGYWAKVRSERVQDIIDIVSDLYLNPIFEPLEIERERGVVTEEINMYEDTPMRRVQELFTSLLYGDQPAGWDVAGRKEIIKKLTRRDFLRYRTSHYVAPKTVVVVAGNVRPKEVQRQITKLFDSFPRARRIRKQPVREHQRAPAALVKFKSSDQSHLVLGTRAFGVMDPRRYALEVLSNVLGGGMSSRLFRRIREELGAAYYVRASAELTLDHGYLAVSSGVDHSKMQIVVRAILEELARFSQELVPADEFMKSKEHMTGNLVLSLESSDELASFYGGQEVLRRKLVSPAEIIKRIHAVSREEIRTLARALFVNRNLNLAAIGPYRNAKIFTKILTF